MRIETDDLSQETCTILVVGGLILAVLLAYFSEELYSLGGKFNEVRDGSYSITERRDVERANEIVEGR